MKFKDMSPDQQKEYLKKHPNSKFNKSNTRAKPKQWAGQSRSEKMRHKAFHSYFWADK
jgi:hypothetical protein